MGQQKVLWRPLRREISGASEDRAEALKTGSHTARYFLIGKKERDQFKLNQYKWLRGLHQIRSRLFPYTPGTGNRYRFQRLETSWK